MENEIISFSKKELPSGDMPIFQNTFVYDTKYSENISLSALNIYDCIELAFVISGEGTVNIMGEIKSVEKGDIFLINKGVPHGFFAKNKQEVAAPTVCSILFEPSCVFPTQNAKTDSSAYVFGFFTSNPIYRYVSAAPYTLGKIVDFYELIESELSRQQEFWINSATSYLTNLLIFLRRYMGHKEVPEIKNINKPVSNLKDRIIIMDVMREVKENFGNSELSLQGIAKKMYVSKSYLCRTFLKETGEYFSDYIRNVRLSEARNLLSSTNLSNKDIAFRCGLNDIPTFYKQFKARYDETPNTYRKNISSIYKGENQMDIIEEICENLQKGKAKIVKELVTNAIEQGISADKILTEGLIKGMGIIGEKFKNNEVYVPEVLVAARAMNKGAELLKPLLAEEGVKATGKVCIGTVEGDLHDIGKNLVKMMLEGKGLEVIDLGTDVPAEKFVSCAIEEGCQIICCSALLTTTMGVMEDVVKEAEKAGIRSKVKIMIGGAPVTQEYCDKIGADAYTPDAASASEVAVKLCKEVQALG